MTEALLQRNLPMMWREWAKNGRLKAELLRLFYSTCWFGLAAITMAMVQMSGDTLHARNIRAPLENATTLLQLPTFNAMFDVAFTNLPHIPPTSLFNPDNMLHSFILVSVVAGLLHWPLYTVIARLRRFVWLFGAGYFLRMCSLASTVLPPSNPFCVPVERNLLDMIITAPQLLFGITHTCTDKLFSGHTLVTTLLIWFWMDARTVAGDGWFSLWRLYPLVHSLLMVFASVMGWNHYTVDIVLAFIIATLLYWTYKELLVIDQLWRKNPESGMDTEEARCVPKWLAKLCGWCDGADLVNSSISEAIGENQYINIV